MLLQNNSDCNFVIQDFKKKHEQKSTILKRKINSPESIVWLILGINND